jgi:hypothetical protein
MNLKRLLLTASCREGEGNRFAGGARGRLARRATAEADFVRAIDETDRLLRIDPPEPDAEAPRRVVRALQRLDPAPAAIHARWRSAAMLALTTAAAATITLAPVALWRAAGPGPAPIVLAEESAPAAPAQPARLTWTLVASIDHPLRAEAAALAADMRQFGHLVAPGVMPAQSDER